MQIFPIKDNQELRNKGTFSLKQKKLFSFNCIKIFLYLKANYFGNDYFMCQIKAIKISQIRCVSFCDSIAAKVWEFTTRKCEGYLSGPVL